MNDCIEVLTDISYILLEMAQDNMRDKNRVMDQRNCMKMKSIIAKLREMEKNEVSD